MGRKKKVEEETDPEEFYVEVIKAARVVAADPDDETQSPRKKKKKKGKGKAKEEEPPPAVWTSKPKEYYVKWFGYDESADTWEPAGNLESCKELIKRFWEAVGVDDNDYTIGTELEAPEDWIEREAARFRREHEKEKQEKRKKQEEKEKRKREKEAAKREKKEKQRQLSQPQASTSTSSLKLKISKKRPRIESSDSEEDDSDTPLAKKRTIVKEEKTPRLSSKSISQSSRTQTPADDTPKQKKRKRSEESDSGLPPAKQPHADEDRASPDSLFSDSGSFMEMSFSNTEDIAAARANVPAPVSTATRPQQPVITPAPGPSTSVLVMPQPPPLPSRKGALAPVRRGGMQDPLAKFPSISQEVGPSSSGISTKARLAQGALAPMLPRKANSGVLNKPEPMRTGSSTIMATNFRKSSGISAAQQQHEPTLASLNATPGSPLMGSSFGSLTDGPVVNSPTTFDPPEDPFRLAPSSTMVDDQVNEFLSSIMPHDMAGPLEPAAERPVDPVPPPPLPSKAAPPLPTRKTFKWEGSLAVACGESNLDVPEVSCPIIMEQIDTTLKQKGVRFSFFFKPAGLDKLDVRQLYDLEDLPPIMSTCSSPTHFAKVYVQPSVRDRRQWNIFWRYLKKFRRVVLIPLTLDKHVVAQLLIAPSQLYSPLMKLEEAGVSVGPSIENMVACILPHSLTPKQMEGEYRPKRAHLQEARAHIAVKRHPRFDRSLKSRPLFQEAMRVLDFPIKTYDFLKQTNRSWAICTPLDSTPSKTFLEVEMLRSILTELRDRAAMMQRKDPSNKAKYPMMREASKPDTAGLLFIHVGALKHLRRLHFLRSRLLAPEYVRFYTFGSHPSVYQKFWGVREVFPCGGVVTFLPSTFLNYPLEIMETIRKINEHPFWTAYILPSVLGMVARLSGADANATSAWAYAYLLRAIEAGELALIEAPPEAKFTFGELSSDRRTRWFHDYLSAIPPSQDEALSFALGAFSSITANTRPADWPVVVEKEVAQDLARMQTQPSLMTDYRRYVVLTGVPVSRQDTLEWLSPVDFTFRDSFLSD